MTPIEYLMLRLAVAWYEFAEEVRAITWKPAGASDPDWSAALHSMAEPVKRARLAAEKGKVEVVATREIPIVVVGPSGRITVGSTPVKDTPEHSPEYIADRRLMAAQSRLAYKVQGLAHEAMLELGMDVSEVLHQWNIELSIERTIAEARSVGVRV